MFLAHFFPLSERSGNDSYLSLPFTLLIKNSLLFMFHIIFLFSYMRYHSFFLILFFVISLMLVAVNIKGVSNTSNETKYEKDAPDGNI